MPLSLLCVHVNMVFTYHCCLEVALCSESATIAPRLLTTPHYSQTYDRYAHYDNKASFSDFTKFGGWTSPHAKQYAGGVTRCR